jgi:hypothetical protein
MAVAMTVRPGEWNEWAGVWFIVRPDPLAGAEFVRVTVHLTATDLWLDADGPCAGFRFQTVAPDLT